MGLSGSPSPSVGQSRSPEGRAVLVPPSLKYHAWPLRGSSGVSEPGAGFTGVTWFTAGKPFSWTWLLCLGLCEFFRS